MSDNGDFQYVRPVDFDKLKAAAPDQRVSQRLLAHENGATNCQLMHIKTPAGTGSPEGMHTHEVDQVFYLLSGTMSIEIDGVESKVGPGNAIVFPKGVPHRNWNEEETIHLAFMAPLPDPTRPAGTPVA